MGKLQVGLALVFGLSGCVTAETTSTSPATAVAAPEAAPVAAAAPAPVPTALTGVQPVATVPQWQQVLASDAAELETRGSAFLEASWDLYDQLLDEAPASPERTRKVNAAVKLSADRYTELTAAVARLHADLDRPGVRSSLPVADAEGRRELEAMDLIFPAYAAPSARTFAAYDLAGGPSVTTVLFADREHDQSPGLDGLPKSQRDALLLLDYLRDVSNDMAFMSHAVVDWTDTAH